MARSITRWLLVAIILWGGKAVVMALAPIIALPPFVRFAEESETTGFSSQFPGVRRAFLIPPLMGAQTHDDCLDAFWYAKRFGRWIERYSQEYYDTHWWLRYYCYVAWLWRNPAYGLAEALGFDQTGLTIIRQRDDGTWRQPVTDYQYWIARNARGQWGFMLRGQIRLWGRTYMEYRLGYGLYRESPKRGRGMLYARIFKIRTY